MLKSFKPEIFQGNIKKVFSGKAYFEGWYFKNVSADKNSILSFIPGICFGDSPHCFIQMINGISAETVFFEYPPESFAAAGNRLELKIEQNVFTKNGISLSLENDRYRISGSLAYSNLTEWKKSPAAPGIMGWYSFVPFMECYHGLVSADHDIQGSLTINKKKTDFNNGKGYIEKDWGRSFPAAWIWMQSNHFSGESASFMLSVAKIPWTGKSFTGFLGYLYFQGRIIPLATWKGHKVKILDHSPSGVKLKIFLNRKESITVSAVSSVSGSLKAPRKGAMGRIIKESVNASLRIDLDLKTVKRTITGDCAGLESVYPELLLT